MTVESEIRKAPFYAIPNLTEASVAFCLSNLNLLESHGFITMYCRWIIFKYTKRYFSRV